MSQHDNENFEEIEARLEAERPQLSSFELDRLMLRCRPGKARANRKKESMRSRIAITALLVMGFALSSTGVGLAISGVSGSGSAGEAQYPSPPTTPTPPPPPTTPEEPPAPPTTTPKPPPDKPARKPSRTPSDTQDEGDGGGVLGTQDEGTPPSAPVQATEQVSTTSDSNQLPFTGFAVIPVLLAGVAMMLAGLFLRRRSNQSPDA